MSETKLLWQSLQKNLICLKQSEQRFSETDPKQNPNWATLNANSETLEVIQHQAESAKQNLGDFIK